MRRKTHTPESHRWKPLPWFFLLRRQPLTIQATEVEWETPERHQSNSRSNSGVTSRVIAAVTEYQQQKRHLQQQSNRSGIRATSERQHRDSRATAEREQYQEWLRSDSRSNSSGATAVQKRWDSGATTERLLSQRYYFHPFFLFATWNTISTAITRNIF